MQCLAQDMAELAELQEEVTQAQAANVMVRAHAAQVEGTAQEKVALLAIIDGEVAEVTQRVSALGDELVTVRWAWDVAVEKVLSRAAEAVTADR
jgi:hypothetical protein